MQYSVHLPNPYIYTHWQRLLPDWSMPVLSVLVVLQRCPVILLHRTAETEFYKDLLRQQFLASSEPIVRQLQQMGHLAALFDPRTGQPVGTRSGDLCLDDVAVVRSLLDYAVIDQGGCSIMMHPTWEGAVYPSILLCSAPPLTLERVVEMIALEHDQIWQRIAAVKV